MPADISLSHEGGNWLRLKLQHIFWRMISGLPDRSFIRWKYFSMSGRFPDLEHPRLFTEKVQARKLFDRNPLYPVMVDKAAAKDLIRERVGQQYVVPTYWVGRDLATVDWTKIPLPAVVKPTHGSGSGVFLRTQEDINDLMANNPSWKWLSLKFHRINREWAYGEFEPLIIIEKMLVDEHDVPDDYRFFIFSNRIAHVEIRFRRDGVGYEAYYTSGWKNTGYASGYYRPYPMPVRRPQNFEEMIDVATRIAGDSDFMRVDLYNVGGKIYVGELTIYPGGGFKGCIPDDCDERLGALWDQRFTHGQGTNASRSPTVSGSNSIKPTI